MSTTGRPKQQRTRTVLLKDRGTTAALTATLTITRRCVVRKSGILMTDGLDDDECAAAYDRLCQRCERLARLLQQRWFGEAT